MILKEFLENYRGNACISIDGYCEEKRYDYYTDVDDDYLSDDNPNHYKPTCLARESWWNEVKDREIKSWNIIGGGCYQVELWQNTKSYLKTVLTTVKRKENTVWKTSKKS